VKVGRLEGWKVGRLLVGRFLVGGFGATDKKIERPAMAVALLLNEFHN
jgi:hypothetical protein